MSDLPPYDDRPTSAAVLRDRDAGDMAIRGGAMRVGGYLVGTALVAAASVILLRHLGVVDFGHYVAVMSLVAIAAGVTDAGLTVVGQREYVLADGAEQRRLLGNVLGIRLLVTPVGVAVAGLFAVLAGYPEAMVLGTLIAGAGVVLATAGATLTLPLSARLRLGALTFTEIVRQVVIVAGLGLLVLAGGGLLSFFSVQVAAGAAVLLVAALLVGPRDRAAPRVDRAKWAHLLRETAPLALGLILNVVYVRALVVLSTLVTSDVEVGLFATSFRILEALTAVPALMVGAAFPILVRAHADDAARLAYALQRIGEVALLAAGGLVLVLVVAAEPIVRILGGEEYLDAVPVLRIHALSLVGAFLVQVAVFALITLRRQSALIAVNGVALVSVLALGLGLVPALGAEGAAIAAAAGEAILALAGYVMLVRERPDLRPHLGHVPRVLLAAALGAGAALLPGVPPLAAAALGGVVYLATAWVVRAVPVELVAAVRRR
jgi:O-antigen/teichoic acid export membrane protein